MMETYYGFDDNGELQDLWDNDFNVVSGSSRPRPLCSSSGSTVKFNVISTATQRQQPPPAHSSLCARVYRSAGKQHHVLVNGRPTKSGPGAVVS